MRGTLLRSRLTAPRHSALYVAFVVSIAATGTAYPADNLLGLYVGGSIARSDLHLDNSWTATPTGTDEVVAHHTAWTASVGIRPLRHLGVELQYLDFGRLHWDGSYRISPGGFTSPVNATVHTNAEALAAVLYAPIPLPFLDVYAKLGPTHWHSTASGEILGLFCPVNLPDCGRIEVRHDGTDLAYGAGLQLRFGPGAVRIEYQRIEASPEYPALYGLGLTWTF
jgi:hypothetical protein